jgi:outer membrane lipoprotein SlyB
MMRILLLGMTLVLAGCAGSNVSSHWTCEASQPEECHSVSDGDEIALENIKESSDTGLPSDLLSGGSWTDTAEDRVGMDDGEKDLSQYRTTEELAQIWVGAFVDDDGNYHPAGEMYIVIRESKWKR